jgi:hypothetical protein
MSVRLSAMLVMLGFVWPVASWAVGPTVAVESGMLAGEANGSIWVFTPVRCNCGGAVFAREPGAPLALCGKGQ